VRLRRALLRAELAGISIAAGSNLSGVIVPSGWRRSRPPAGAIQMQTPPAFSSFCISLTVFRFCFIFADLSDGSSFMCFLLCTHRRFFPMLNGLHRRSVTTRSPATYVT
jgi:hypothetical protein